MMDRQCDLACSPSNVFDVQRGGIRERSTVRQNSHRLVEIHNPVGSNATAGQFVNMPCRSGSLSPRSEGLGVGGLAPGSTLIESQSTGAPLLSAMHRRRGGWGLSKAKPPASRAYDLNQAATCTGRMPSGWRSASPRR